MQRANIEAERARHGFTKARLAEVLGITPETYNSYVKGNVIPSDKLLEMHNLFKVSTDYLLGISPTP